MKILQVSKYLEFVGHFSEPLLRLANRVLYERGIGISYPRFVGLMLSRVCDGYCLFCPISGVRDHLESKFMDLKIVKKVVDGLAVRDFRGVINLGENGDGLLNPNFRKIAEYISDNLDAQLIFFTNAKRVDEDTSRFLLDIGISKFLMDMDGATKETYEFMKTNCNFEEVTENLRTFIRLRNERDSDCKVHIIVAPARRYMELREEKTDIPYDVDEIVKYWDPFLRKTDEITEMKYFYNWTHSTDEVRTKSCPLFSQFFDKCFVSTDGNVYGCCLDYKTQLTFGNILEESLEEIWNDDKRKRTIENIVNRDYEKVGEPCLHCSEKNDHLQSYLNFLKYAGRLK